MSALRARRYEPEHLDAWDELVAGSWNGTFLHTRRYLACTQSGTTDASFVVEDAKGRLVGVLPAAVHATDSSMLESHPSAAYGGIVHRGDLDGERMVAALEAVADHCYHDGWRTLRYKAVPQIYARVPADDDRYALFRLGALRSRCDVASVIDLRDRLPSSSRRARSLRKAQRAGVQVAEGPEYLDPLWSVVAGRLARKFDAEPLHDVTAIARVRSAFPERVDCIVGLLGGRVVAGVVVFRTGRVDHAQYVGADDDGYRVAALDAVIAAAIDASAVRGSRYFSLGNNTLYGGRVFNESLHAYKAGFGAGAIAHECFDLRLD